MRKEYDFSKSVKNPYIEKLKKPVTIEMEMDVFKYFKEMPEKTNIPYPTLINLYLKDCATSQRTLSFS